MSLLLDALKKSDQERRKRDVPDLDTVHSPPPKKRRSLLPVGVVLGVLCLNGLLWWAWSSVSGPSDPAASSHSSSEAVQSQKPSASAGLALPKASPPSSAADLRPNLKPGNATPAPRSSEAVVARNQIFRWQELPMEVRRAVLDYQLSMHYFAAEPSSRLVRLNGHLLREGQLLPDGTRVLEIREEGVVLQRGGTRFLMPGGG